MRVSRYGVVVWLILAGCGASRASSVGIAGGSGGSGGSAGSSGSAGNSEGSADAQGGAPIGNSDAGRGDPPASTEEYYIAAQGNDANPGTQALPFKTLAKGNEVAKPGTTLWVMPGTIEYAATMVLSKSGTEAHPIRIWAMPETRSILDYALQPRGASAMRGIEVRGNYWHIKGLEIQKA